jgi:type IV secretion system protein VirD4
MMLNQKSGQENSMIKEMAILAVLAVSMALFLVFGKILQWTTSSLSLTDTLAQFFTARIQGTALTQPETTAVFLFVSSLVALLLIMVFVVLTLRPRINKFKEQQKIKNRFSSEQGTAGWASSLDLQTLAGKDGVLVGYESGTYSFIKPKEVRLSMNASCEHLAVIGPTGCGKTTRFFIPNILTADPNTSMIITDPKGELEQITGPILRSRGWETYTFSINNPICSFNPLAIVRKDTEVYELANITLQNGYSSGGQAGDTQCVNFALPLWESALFAELYLAKKESRIPLITNAYDFLIDKSSEEQIDIVSEEGGPAYKSYLAYMQAAQAPETISSIKMVATTSLKLFTRPDIQKAITQGQPFEPKWLREKPVAYFIQIPEHKANLMKPLAATIYWQLMEHLIETPGLPIIFFLDEFANIGKIPGFAQMAATLRSRKISLNICLQGIEQLSREYSKEEQVDIINNMKTKIYFPGSSGESGEHFSGMAGRSTSRIGGIKQGVNLMTADELRRIPDNHVVVMAHNLNPIMLKSIPWYENKAFKKYNQSL